MTQDFSVATTKKREVVDITDQVNQLLDTISTKADLCHLFVKHTTAALTTADLDPGTDQDLLDVLERLIPPLQFRHPHNPTHTPDHILSSLIGTSLTIPIKDSHLNLGTWQRVILIELDGPRDRSLTLTIQ